MTTTYGIINDKDLLRFFRWFNKVYELKRSVHDQGHHLIAGHTLYLELDRQLVHIQSSIDYYLNSAYVTNRSIPDLAQALVDKLFEETK